MGAAERVSRGESIQGAGAVWVPEMAVVRGEDEDAAESGGTEPCPGFAPGSFTTISTPHGTSMAVRRCNHCGVVESKHPPADSQRRTLLPPPDPVADEPTWPTKLTPYQAAVDVIAELMGPAETWFERERISCVARLGRELNEHEVAALKSYVCGASIDLLRELIRELAKP